jgi:hypothetical protein
MAMKCANRCCPAIRQGDEGKLYRLDLELGSKAGGTECKTDYLWLCDECAQRIHPRIDVCGDTVTVRLTSNRSMPPANSPEPRLWLN